MRNSKPVALSVSPEKSRPCAHAARFKKRLEFAKGRRTFAFHGHFTVFFDTSVIQLVKQHSWATFLMDLISGCPAHCRQQRPGVMGEVFRSRYFSRTFHLPSTMTRARKARVTTKETGRVTLRAVRRLEAHCSSTDTASARFETTLLEESEASTMVSSEASSSTMTYRSRKEHFHDKDKGDSTTTLQSFSIQPPNRPTADRLAGARCRDGCVRRDTLDEVATLQSMFLTCSMHVLNNHWPITVDEAIQLAVLHVLSDSRQSRLSNTQLLVQFERRFHSYSKAKITSNIRRLAVVWFLHFDEAGVTTPKTAMQMYVNFCKQLSTYNAIVTFKAKERSMQSGRPRRCLVVLLQSHIQVLDEKSNKLVHKWLLDDIVSCRLTSCRFQVLLKDGGKHSLSSSQKAAFQQVLSNINRHHTTADACALQVRESLAENETQGASHPSTAQQTA